MIDVEVANRSGIAANEAGAADLARRVLAARGLTMETLGIAFVSPAEIRTLKAEHLGIDEATDVLSFPWTGMTSCRQECRVSSGDVVLCPQVVGDAWSRRSSTGCLHLLASTTVRRWRRASARPGR